MESTSKYHNYFLLSRYNLITFWDTFHHPDICSQPVRNIHNSRKKTLNNQYGAISFKVQLKTLDIKEDV